MNAAQRASSRPVIRTASGKLIDLLNPSMDRITLTDIATGLANLSRYAAQGPFYSLAQHSVMVSRIVHNNHALEALMCRAAAAYIGHIPDELRDAFPQYTAIEQTIDQVIRQQFRLPGTRTLDVKKAMKIVTLTERRDILPLHVAGSPLTQDGLRPLSENIRPMSVSAARDLFLDRAKHVFKYSQSGDAHVA